MQYVIDSRHRNPGGTPVDFQADALVALSGWYAVTHVGFNRPSTYLISADQNYIYIIWDGVEHRLELHPGRYTEHQMCTLLYDSIRGIAGDALDRVTYDYASESLCLHLASNAPVVVRMVGESRPASCMATLGFATTVRPDTNGVMRSDAEGWNVRDAPRVFYISIKGVHGVQGVHDGSTASFAIHNPRNAPVIPRVKYMHRVYFPTTRCLVVRMLDDDFKPLHAVDKEWSVVLQRLGDDTY